MQTPRRSNQELLVLIKGMVGGDVEARTAVWMEIRAFVDGAYLPQLNRLARDTDARRELFVRLMKKLERNDMIVLRRYMAKNRSNVWGWLRVALRHLAVDFVRSHRQNVGGRKTIQWVPDSLPLDDATGQGMNLTRALDVLTMLAKLTGDGQAVQAWYLRHVCGGTWADVAAEVGSPSAGAIRARVRRAFMYADELCGSDLLSEHDRDDERAEDEQTLNTAIQDVIGAITGHRRTGMPEETLKASGKAVLGGSYYIVHVGGKGKIADAGEGKIVNVGGGTILNWDPGKDKK